MAHHGLHGVELIPFVVHLQAKVSAADPEGIHLAIHFSEQVGRALHVAIGADALDSHLFAE